MIILKKLDPGMYRPGHQLFISRKEDKLKVRVLSFELKTAIYEYSFYTTENSKLRYGEFPGITKFSVYAKIEKIGKNYSGSLGDFKIGDKIKIEKGELYELNSCHSGQQSIGNSGFKLNDYLIKISSDITGKSTPLVIPRDGNQNDNVSYDYDENRYSSFQIGYSSYEVISYYKIIDDKKIYVVHPDVTVIYDDCGLRNVIVDDYDPQRCFPTLEKAQQKLEEILF